MLRLAIGTLKLGTTVSTKPVPNTQFPLNHSNTTMMSVFDEHVWLHANLMIMPFLAQQQSVQLALTHVILTAHTNASVKAAQDVVPVIHAPQKNSSAHQLSMMLSVTHCVKPEFKSNAVRPIKNVVVD